jgi:uncharacterized repeat protein (TIGR01451 family)
VGAESGDPDPDDNAPDAPLVIDEGTGAPSADLSIVKTASPNPILPGAQLTFTLTISNAGPDAASNVVVTDDLDEGLTFQSFNAPGWDCSININVVTCGMDSLAASASSDIKIIVMAPTTGFGSIENTASVSADTDDPDTSDNSPDTPITVPENVAPDPIFANVSLVISPEEMTILQGSSSILAASVQNISAETATDVLMTVEVPAALGFVAAQGEGWSCTYEVPYVSCERDSLAPGTAPDIAITLQGDLVGTTTGEGMVTSTLGDDNPTDNQDTFNVIVSAGGIFIPLVVR